MATVYMLDESINQKLNAFKLGLDLMEVPNNADFFHEYDGTIRQVINLSIDKNNPQIKEYKLVVHYRYDIPVERNPLIYEDVIINCKLRYIGIEHLGSIICMEPSNVEQPIKRLLTLIEWEAKKEYVES